MKNIDLLSPMKDVDKIEELEERIKHFEGVKEENGFLTEHEQEILDDLKSEREGYGKICEDCNGTGKQRRTVDTDGWCVACNGTGIKN